MFWSSSPTTIILGFPILLAIAIRKLYSFWLTSWYSSTTITVLDSTLSNDRLSSLIAVVACSIIFSERVRSPKRPNNWKAKPWKVWISTANAMGPASCSKRLLNTCAAGREKVSIKNCSGLTSSMSNKEATLWTNSLVLPLPGPAATRILSDLACNTANCSSDKSPCNCNKRSSVIGFFNLLFCSRLKYLPKNSG